MCEFVGLDCVLLLMDTVNVSSRVRTIAYRMYRTPVRNSIHYLCNVNNTPSSDSWCCFSLTWWQSSLHENCIWFRLEQSMSKFGTASLVKLSSLEKSRSFAALLNWCLMMHWPKRFVKTSWQNLQYQFKIKTHESIRAGVLKTKQVLLDSCSSKRMHVQAEGRTRLWIDSRKQELNQMLRDNTSFISSNLHNGSC